MSDYHETFECDFDTTAYHVLPDEEFAAKYPDHPWSKEWLAQQEEDE